MDKVQFSEALRFLTKIGLSPHQDNTLSYIRKVLFIIIYFCVMTLSCIEVFVNFNKITAVRAFEVMPPYYQNMWKIFVLVKHKNKLKILIELSKNFWGLGDFGKYQKNINVKTHDFFKKSFLIYRRLVYFSVVQYMTAAIFNKKPMLLSYGETEGLHVELKCCYFVLHTGFLFICVCLLFGFDGLFFYIIAHILSELKMIKVAFGNTNIHIQLSYEKRLRLATEHHRFALKFVHCVDHVYSMMLLNQQLSVTFALCFATYLLIENGMPPDYEHVTKYVPYIVAYFLQVWMYCFAGDLISSWSTEIADEVFNENWLLNRAYQHKLEKIIILQRSQRSGGLTLAGFRKLDFQNFTLVVKNAASFFTFIHTTMKK